MIAAVAIPTQPWAPAGMGKGGDRGKGGGTCPLPSWKCCKVFCALAVAVKRSVDQLFMHYFYNFLSAPHFFAGRGRFGGSE